MGNRIEIKGCLSCASKLNRVDRNRRPRNNSVLTSPRLPLAVVTEVPLVKMPFAIGNDGLRDAAVCGIWIIEGNLNRDARVVSL